MAKELPYFKFEPSEWLEGEIQICSDATIACFINLCSGYWLKLGCISYAFALHKYCRKDESVLKELIEKNIISVIDDNIAINFLDRQLNEFQETSEKRREAANKRWSNASALQEQSKSNAIREEKIIGDKIKKESEADTPPPTPPVEKFDFFGVGLPMSKKEISNLESMKIAARHYYAHGEKKYTDQLWKEFHAYWYAVDKSGKPLWIRQKTFNIPGRISTFSKFDNQSKPNQSATQQPQTVSAPRATKRDEFGNVIW